ncbi:MAG: penicillin-binding protein 1A, partial [Parahaliea sp.]
GYIGDEQYQAATAEAVSAAPHGAQISFAADYAAEMVRQEMLERYGIGAYDDGYQVYTTISSRLQQVAQHAVIEGLKTYDRRHGYRGPERQMPPAADADIKDSWLAALRDTPVVAELQPAVVTSVGEDRAGILLDDGTSGEILWDDGLRQARRYISENSRSDEPATTAEVLAVGDLVRVYRGRDALWHLGQVPAAQAALVSLNPDNGAILSLVGGLGFEDSKFNRATQARRQPGSNFKPFLYSAALDAGFTAASLINDAPVVVDDSSLEGMWRPENDSGKFYGPTRLRWALTKSRNLVSIRLLQQLGVGKLLDYIDRFGFDISQFEPNLSLALGTQTASPLEIATAYAILANGGFRVQPFLIQRIEDFNGDTVYEARPDTVCHHCGTGGAKPREDQEELSMEEILAQQTSQQTTLPQARQVMDERVNFIINSMLQDVITQGTGHRALELGRKDLAGKTGTTNGPMDAWFSGYNRDVVTTTWVGFDQYTPLGRREFGGTAALPIWIDFMRVALEDSPDVPRAMPPGIVLVRIDPDTGELAQPGQQNAILEYFRKELVPEHSNGNGGEVNDTRGTEDLIRDIF